MPTRTRTVVVASLVVALAVGFFVTGGVLYKTAIDLDAPAFPAGAVIDRCGAGRRPRLRPADRRSVLGSRDPPRGADRDVRRGPRIDPGARDRSRPPRLPARGSRRSRRGGGCDRGRGRGRLGARVPGLGNDGRGWEPVFTKIFDRDIVFTNPEYPEDWKGARIGAHRRLGRTNFEVSDIVVGGGADLRAEGRGHRAPRARPRRQLRRHLARLLRERQRGGASARRSRAAATASSSRRSSARRAGHLAAGTSVAGVHGPVEASLARLAPNYVDLVHVHSCDETERLLDPNMHEAFDRLREAGQGALPRLQLAHAEPRGGGERGDRVRSASTS